VTKRPKGQTFAELLNEPTWSEGAHPRTGEHAVRPGHFNRAGEFFDPEGRQLRLRHEDIEPEEARARVAAGAWVAFEACGCGGNAPGCSPEWFTGDRLERLPRSSGPERVRGYSAPTWFDVWTNEAVEVVFAHGSLAWGDELG
jgi:hypothetical protein